MCVLEILLWWELPRVKPQFVIIVLLVSSGSYFTLSPHCKALLFYLIISPVPTCLVHNCETSRGLVISICCHPCLKINSLWSPSMPPYWQNCSSSMSSQSIVYPAMSHLIEEQNLCLSFSDSWLMHWIWGYILPQDTTRRLTAKPSTLIKHSNNSWGSVRG